MMTIHEIIALAANHWGVSRCDVMSDRRDARSVLVRHAAMWLTRHGTPHSLPAIGQAFNRRDHTTVRHAITRTEARMATDAVFARRVWRLLGQIDPAGAVELRRLRMRTEGEAA